jgi:hypothetical protein
MIVYGVWVWEICCAFFVLAFGVWRLDFGFWRLVLFFIDRIGLLMCRRRASNLTPAF